MKKVLKPRGQIWVQTVGKGYQQTTIVAASKELVKDGHFLSNMIINKNIVFH